MRNAFALVSDDLRGGNRSSLNAWDFESSSSDKTYTVTLWNDGYISCTCKGWAIFKEKTIQQFGQRRWCKHLTVVESEATRQYNQYRKQIGGVVNPAPVRDPRTGRVDFVGRPESREEYSEAATFPPEEQLRKVVATENTKAKQSAKPEPEKLNLRTTRAFDV